MHSELAEEERDLSSVPEKHRTVSGTPFQPVQCAEPALIYLSCLYLYLLTVLVILTNSSEYIDHRVE